MGKPQIIKNLHQKDDMIVRVEKAQGYLHNIVMVEDHYEVVSDMCRNFNKSCACSVGH